VKAIRGTVGLLAVATLVGACAMPFEMQRATPVSTFCPEQAQSRSVDGPPDTTELRWYRSVNERDMRLGAQWCATVGGPVMRLAPTSSFPPWEEPAGLEVVTWNMNIGGGDLFDFLHTELGLDCTAPTPTLEGWANPFVLLLQEVYRFSEDLPVVASGSAVPWTIDPEDRPGEDPDIVEAAERCGLAFVYVPSARNGPDSGSRPSEDKGNAVLSTLPLTAPIAIDLPHEGGRKVAVAATVNAPGGERVRVVSVHLDVASTLARTLTSGNQTRARQVSGLIDGLARAQRDGPLTAATLVGGDFNTWAGNETTLRLMRQAFPESPEWDGRGTRGSFPTDHMYFRRGSFRTLSIDAYRRLDDRYNSDHLARRLTVHYDPVRSH